ncbi:MAG: hypothetical protein JKY37_04175 [Nannocystaceae bacterium]|nr:hypothetical protein [Nannocystaceae bacterium]
MSKPNRSIPRIVVASALLTALTLAVGCAKSGDEAYVQFVNGFEFDVTATVTNDEGETKTLPIPALGRTGADFVGSSEVRVETADGKLVSEGRADFGKRDEREDRCHFFYNVLGSAAIRNEGLVFGIAHASSYTTAGVTRTNLCYSWGFETKEAPKSISTTEESVGQAHHWLHYIDDGSWHVTVRKLFNAKDPDRKMGVAQQIVRAVGYHDPDNALLGEIKALFAERDVWFPPAVSPSEYAALLAKGKKDTAKRKTDAIARELGFDDASIAAEKRERDAILEKNRAEIEALANKP